MSVQRSAAAAIELVNLGFTVVMAAVILGSLARSGEAATLRARAASVARRIPGVELVEYLRSPAFRFARGRRQAMIEAELDAPALERRLR